MQVIFDLIVIALLFIKIIVPKLKKQKRNDAHIALTFFVYLVLVYSLTLMPFRPLENIATLNLDWTFNLYPFADIIYSRGPAKLEAFLNVLLILPFGFFLPLVKIKRVNAYSVALSSFLLSLGIETLQMLDPLRASDVTDLITNTLGGVLGYALYKLLSEIKRNKIEKRKE